MKTTRFILPTACTVISVPRLLAILAIVAGLLLTGCETTTTGGFNTEASDEQALQDFIQLASRYLEQGDLTNAKRHLQNAERYEANNSEVMAIWALIYSREGEHQLADQSFQRALRLEPGNSQARNNYAAYLFANGRLEEAFDQLQRVVQDTNYPARAQAFENLGLAAMRLERVEVAENAFSRALQLNSNQLRSSLELASINLDKGDVLQARAYYRNFLTLLQFLNSGQSARSLLVGVRLEAAMGNIDNVRRYGSLLATSFANTPEFRMYQDLLETLENE